MLKRIAGVAVVLALVCGVAATAWAVPYTWGGGVGGPTSEGRWWHDTHANAWNGGPPGVGDTGTVTSGMILASTTAFAGTLNIDPAAGQTPKLYVIYASSGTVAQLNMYGGQIVGHDDNWSGGPLN